MKFQRKIIYVITWLLLTFPAVEAAELSGIEDRASDNSAASVEVVVIVNNNNPLKSLTAREVSDIFLARRRTFPSGSAILVLDQQRNSLIRENFFHLLNKMTLKQVNAYWARLQFSGEVQPPESLADSSEVLEAVKDNPAAIGYIDAGSVNNSVRVILDLK